MTRGEPSPPPLVCIVDDDEDVRDALAWLLRTRGLESVAFGSAHAFQDFAKDEAALAGRPVCILLDVRMPRVSGIELFESMSACGELADVPVIFLTGHGDVPMAVQALKRGAFDFFEKPCPDNALVDRVIEALQVARERLDLRRGREALARRVDALTEREREVMGAILAGKLNKVIADELRISMRTVEVHRARIFAKMGVRSAVELANLLK